MLAASATMKVSLEKWHNRHVLVQDRRRNMTERIFERKVSQRPQCLERFQRPCRKNKCKFYQSVMWLRRAFATCLGIDVFAGWNINQFDLLLSLREFVTGLYLDFLEGQCHGRSTHDLLKNCSSHVDDALSLTPCFFPMVSNGAERNVIAAQCFPYQIDVNSHKRGQTAGVIYDDRVRVGECLCAWVLCGSVWVVVTRCVACVLSVTSVVRVYVIFWYQPSLSLRSACLILSLSTKTNRENMACRSSCCLLAAAFSTNTNRESTLCDTFILQDSHNRTHTNFEISRPIVVHVGLETWSGGGKWLWRWQGDGGTVHSMVKIQNASACAFKTSPCVPADVSKVHTEALTCTSRSHEQIKLLTLRTWTVADTCHAHPLTPTQTLSLLLARFGSFCVCVRPQSVLVCVNHQSKWKWMHEHVNVQPTVTLRVVLSKVIGCE